jgi:hypothetical protein
VPIEVGNLILLNQQPVRVLKVDRDLYHRILADVYQPHDGHTARRMNLSHGAPVAVVSDEPPHVAEGSRPLHERRTALLAWNELINEAYRGRQPSYWNHFFRMLLDSFAPAVPLWFSRSVALAVENPQQLSWTPEPQFFDHDLRRRRGRLTILLRYINKQFRQLWTEEQIERMSADVGDHIINAEQFSFELLEGPALVAAYHAHDAPHTCASGKGYVELYGDNPDVVKMIKVTRRGRYMARALVWQAIRVSDGETVTVLDRIHPNSGTFVQALQEHAREQGWDYLADQIRQRPFVSREQYTVTLANTRSIRAHGPPYMDTFFLSEDGDAEPITFTNVGSMRKMWRANPLNGGAWFYPGDALKNLPELAEYPHQEERMWTAEELDVVGVYPDEDGEYHDNEDEDDDEEPAW